MSRSVIGRLIAKDLYLYRWLILATLAVGTAAIFLAGVEGAPGTVGDILFITSIVVLGVILAMHGLLSERQSQAVLFTLSLPISPQGYAVAKVAGCLIAFLIPWLVFTALIVGLTCAFDPPPDGQLPLVIAMMGFFLANFCLLVAIGLLTRSESWGIAGIIGSNTLVPVFLGIVLPAVVVDPAGAVAIWSPAVLMTLGIEALVVVLSLGLALFLYSRKTDFV